MSSPLVTDDVAVLVVDDEPAVRDLMTSILEYSGHGVPTLARDGVEGLEILRQHDYDILITDLDMPRMKGDEFISAAVKLQPDLTVLVITGFGTIERAVALMKLGAFDFLTKPFELDRFTACLDRARERVASLSELRGIRDVIGALLAALESKDPYLNGHSARVASYSTGLGRCLKLPRKDLKVLEYAALLHDVGKIGVHEDILRKPGRLTPEEFDAIRRHPVYSRDILAPVKFLEPCLPAVLHHHEQVSGAGYPDGLKGDAIPYFARIISIADCFDAMTSQRSYRSSMPIARAVTILEEVSGTQLDSALTQVFLDNLTLITGASRDCHVAPLTMEKEVPA
ncbi:MAG: HD-GYP domain-containing protein [Planctomycetota bacterium]